MPDVKEKCYKELVRIYEMGDISGLLLNRDSFQALAIELDDYKNVSKYKKMREIKLDSSKHDPLIIADHVKFLVENINFADASKVLFSNKDYINQFLTGKWSSEDKKYTLEFKRGVLLYNLNGKTGGLGLSITKNGNVYDSTKSLLFGISIINHNTVDVTDYAKLTIHALKREN
jgi:hypothetical protein